MTDEQHAKILAGYLSRIPLASIEALLSAERGAWQAQANYGTSAQIAAQQNVENVALYAVKQANAHDMQHLARMIRTYA